MSNWKHTIVGVDWASLKLHEREQVFQRVLIDHGVKGDLEQPPYAILWEDPNCPDASCKVTTPSPVWWAMALHGDILPPVEAYWALREDEAQPGFTHHTRGYLLHQPGVPAMTPEEAMEYLVMKELPPHVWRDYQGNRTILRIVPREMIPTNRAFRNAWEMSDVTRYEEAA